MVDVVPKFLAVCIETLSIAADDDKESSNRRRRQQPSDGVIWVVAANEMVVCPSCVAGDSGDPSRREPRRSAPEGEIVTVFLGG